MSGPRRHTIDTEELVRLRREGATLRQIADGTGMPMSTVRKQLATAGRPRARRRRSVPGRNVSVEQVAGPYQAGQGIRAIAASLGVSVGKVRTQLEAAGIQIRRGPRPKPVTAADEDLIRRYQNGESIRVIATSRRTDGKKVRAQLVAAGVRIRRRRDARGLAAVTDEELAGRYQAGQSLGVIAAWLDVDRGRVRARLVAAGVEIRPPGRIRKPVDTSATPKRAPKQLTVSGEELADLYRTGSTVAALVARFGVSKEKVRARLRAEGVAMRRPGRRRTADVAARSEPSASDRPVGRRSWPGGEQPGSAQPASRVVADEAVAPIRSGALVAGSRLPSHRGLTQQAVAPGNARARRAVNLPRQEGQQVTINKTTVVAPPENRPGRREQDKPMSERTGRPGRANLIRQGGMTPIYMQIADLIAKQIANGDLAPGAWIDSERELQSEFGIAQITARSVHRELCDRGLVRTVPGEGTFVNRAWTPLPGEVTAEVTEHRRTDPVRRGRGTGSGVTAWRRCMSRSPTSSKKRSPTASLALVTWCRARPS